MYVQQFFVDGLGCASYLVGCEAQGVAAVIDPDRAVQKYLDAAQAHNLKITHILETHLHADHVSGNTDLAARTGADIYLHADSGATFAHRPVKAGDVLRVGNVRLGVRHTPGHTPESITLLISDETRSARPWLALTGDTLFVGDAGRPDLVGAASARQLAGLLYDSLFDQLLKLDDGVLIYPGHGAGSLCGKSIGSVRSTTIGFERHANPALAPRTRDEFIEFATTGLPEQPGNHTRIKAMNRRGPKPLGEALPKPISIRESIPYFQQGAALLDTRSKADYIQAHVPGAVHLEADDQLSNRVGFVLPPDVPLLLIVRDEEEYRRVVYSLARVGYESVIGYLSESLEAWEALGLPITSGDIQDIEPQALHELLLTGNGQTPMVIDVREPWEYRLGHVPGALLVPLGELAGRLDEIDRSRPVAVICQSGNRSQSGAALLGQKGFKTVYNVLGGTGAWAHHGLPIER
jgi:hydroxyacylglutathione hydrolase